MAPEDKMSVDERRKYLHKVQERYERADRTEKGALLDEKRDSPITKHVLAAL
ncbi:MAG: hypothetical protein GX601_08225 [Anaerolineales bacterium]|nr:hypothetical protein [Anaerolineales bacterium]